MAGRVVTAIVVFAAMSSLTASAQNKAQTYFVDGFHGGVYGHYPRNYTQFMVRCLDSIPDWKIGLEIEPATWDVVAVQDPVAYRRFRDYVLDGGRVEYTNPAFGQPYMYNISGESIIRQIKYGSDVLRRHFPGLNLEVYSTAEPCFTSSLPTVLSSLGFKYITTKCPDTLFGGYFGQRGAEIEWWVGPDGESRLLNSPRSLAARLDTFCAWSSLDHSMTKEFVDAAFAEGLSHPVGMTYQDAGWQDGPWLEAFHVDEGPTVGEPDYARPQYILWSDYFKNVAPLENITEYTYSQEDMHPVLQWGAQMFQRMSSRVRNLENGIPVTEKMASLSTLVSGTDYPAADLRLAWEGLMLAQHHDCWICIGDRWYKKVVDWTDNSRAQCSKVLSDVAASITSSDKAAVTVFNTSGNSASRKVAVKADAGYNGIVDSEGNPVPSQRVADSIYFVASVPGFGWASYSLTESGHSPKALTGIRKKGRNVVLYSDIYEIVLSPSRGGAITSIKDIRNGREISCDSESLPFNGLRAYYPEEGTYHDSEEEPASISTVCSGPVFSTVETRGAINGTPFIQRITLTAGDPVIDCSLVLDWQGEAPLIGSHEPEDADKFDQSGNRLSWRPPFYDTRHKMNLLFPLKEQGKIYKDAPFDVCESHLENTYFASFDSLKHNVVLNWVDLETGDGSLALFSDRTNSYIYGPDYPLGLTVQYVGSALWHSRYGVDGPTMLHYALFPHNGRWDTDCVQEENQRWREEFVVAAGKINNEAPTSSLLQLDGTGYQLVTSYFDDGCLHIRLYNASGNGEPCILTPGFSWESAQLVELDGRIREVLPSAGSIELSMPRYGIRTIRFDFQRNSSFKVQNRPERQ